MDKDKNPPPNPYPTGKIAVIVDKKKNVFLTFNKILDTLLEKLKDGDTKLSVTKHEVTDPGVTGGVVTEIGIEDLTTSDKARVIHKNSEYVEDSTGRDPLPIWQVYPDDDESVLKTAIQKLYRMLVEKPQIPNPVDSNLQSVQPQQQQQQQQSDQNPQLSDKDLDYMVNNITKIINLYRDKKKGGKKRSSSNILKTSSSRRGRRSSKKRATKSKPKRRQRRASRRAY